jgi:hypothetical protein
MNPKRPWILILIATPAAASIWAGWVGLGALAGFGPVHLLPGILPRFTVNTAITLPVGVEAYGAYALGAWLRPGTPDAARRFARWSALGALGLGALGQVAYHLLAAFRDTRAPVPVIVIVSCIPVIALGFGAALAHLLRSGGEASSEQPQQRHEIAAFAAPLVTALASRIAPREVTPAGSEVHPAVGPDGHPDPRPAERPASDPGEHPGGSPDGPPAERPGEATCGDPAGVNGDRPASSREVTSVGIARVRRKGAAGASDEEVKAAIRELFAGGNAVTPYRIKAALKGPKGGIGDGRATKLLAEVQAERPSLSSVK